MIKFSIIVPVYKVEKYISNCIESILTQSYKNFELILINDGSPDKCGEICDKYADKDKRIKVIHKKNGGVSSARNIGIQNANGEYIWFVDSDDWIEENALLILFEKIKYNNPDLIIFNSKMIKKNNVIINKFNVDNYELINMNTNEFFNKYYFKYNIGFELWNKLYKKDIITENNIYFSDEETIGEDLLFNLYYYEHINNYLYIKDILYNYLSREDSAMFTKSKNRHINQMSVYDKIYNNLDYIDEDILIYIFIMHLISGINQSKQGLISSQEYSKYLKLYCKKYDFNTYKLRKNIKQFLENENATILGKLRINLFFIMCKYENYNLASKLILGR